MELIQRAELNPDQPAMIMAGSGETLTFGRLRARANQLAHLLRATGLRRGDHFAIFMENHPRYLECGTAGARSGLYFTNVNCFLTAAEVAYILNNSKSQVLITSQSRRAVALEALRECPKVRLCLVVDGPGEGDAVRNLDEAVAGLPETAIPDESSGWAMFYSSGTTGQPKGVLRPLLRPASRHFAPLGAAIAKMWSILPGQICLIPAPLYHSAPWSAATLTLFFNGTIIVMERFDPEEALKAIETHRVSLRAVRSDHVLSHVEAAARSPSTLRPIVAAICHAWSRSLPCASQASDDRLARPDHP